MRPTTRRILTATISAALLVTACSSGDDEAAPTTTESAPTTTSETTTAPSTTAPSTTTTEAPTTTASPTTTEPPSTTTEPPPTTNPGDPDWLTIVQDLVTLQHELRAAPESARLNEFCVAGESTCEAVQGEEIRRLEEEGWRVVGQPQPEVLSARVVETANGDPPSEALWVLLEVVSVRQDQTGALIVDEDNNTVFELSNTGDSPTIKAKFLLSGGGTSNWRVMAIEDLDSE
ncbi:MAG: hypothetical protein KDB37_20220 [Ilumatobacter sp.]|nr:hypothetical protein [Ilumatobacter sp.]